MHIILILILLALLFPAAMRGLARWLGLILIVIIVWFYFNVSDFAEQRRADCVAHQDNAQYWADNECARRFEQKTGTDP